MHPDNIFDLIPDGTDEEVVDLLVQNKHIKIERIVSSGQASPESGWYDQEESEWVIVLAGEALIVFERGEDVTLTAGSQLNIPAHRRHRVAWTSPDTQTIWLAVSYL